MKKIPYIVFLLLALVFPAHISAQVGVHTETVHSSAVLEVSAPSDNQGMRMPSMTTAQKTAILNPASGLLVYDVNQKCLSQNIGTESSPLWICLGEVETNFFCMPSINVLTPNVGAVINVDLYEIYRNQFGTPMASNVSIVPGKSIPVFDSNDLYYYVTYYDKDVITINNISASGVMNYTVKRRANFDTYMNIVFVRR